MTDHKARALEDPAERRALVHATLYLAEQQRIANLIAFMVQYESPTGNNTNFVKFHGDAFTEITRGIGL